MSVGSAEAPMSRELLKAAVVTLEQAQVHRPRWTAEQLLSRHLGCAPVELHLETPPVTDEQALSFQAGVAARAQGVPLPYLLGSAEFYGREFIVGPGVFCPRPETEVLVEAALRCLRMNGASKDDPGLTVADIGTGSGAIAITLALECSGVRVLATDWSSLALGFARRNAERLDAAVSFLQGDLLESCSRGSADLITANLPYLNAADSGAWPRELHWEPWLALDGGEGGLSLIGRLIRQAGSVLKPGGRLLLEIGEGQAGPVGLAARQEGFLMERIVRDLAGLERVAVLRWKS